MGEENYFVVVELTAEEKDLFADVEVEGRNVYDKEVLIYHVRKKNIQDIKNNLRLTLPSPLSAHEEAAIYIQQIFNEWVAKNWDGDGKNISHLC